MADTLKFGPEWLRALSDGNSVTSPPPSPGFAKYKLAEHRYGREEMLALYVPNKQFPEMLREFPTVIQEAPLKPLALIPPSEDEQRLLAQSVNSTAVLRLMGRGAGPVVRGGGRGGGDRGRGRGRGRGEGYFQRGTSFDEEGFGRGRHGRGEGWEEGEKRFERTFPVGRTFEEGQTSPRRDYSRSMSNDNWRDAKKEEDDDAGDWRRAGPREKWGARGSWREPRERGFEPQRDYHGRYEDYQRPYEGSRPPYGRSKSQGGWDDQNDLPEWSTMDAHDMDSLGTFDSSGAFMSVKEAEKKEKYGKDKCDKSEEKEGEIRENGAESEKEAEAIEELTEDQDSLLGEPPDHVGSEEGTPSSDRSHSPHVNTLQRKDSVKDSSPATLAKQARLAGAASSGRSQNVMSEKTDPIKSKNVKVPAPVNIKTNNAGEQLLKLINPHREPSPLSELKEEAALTQEDGAGDVVVEDDDHQFEHLEKAAEELVATWTAEEDAKSDSKAKVEYGSVPLDHEDAKKWFYRDPQGDLQGPFTSTEMAEWFSAGYFTMNLLVKRGCDERFHPLGGLIKQWGRVPFVPGHSPPPMKTAGAAAAAAQIPAAAVEPDHSSFPPQQPQPAVPQAPPEQMKVMQQQHNMMILQQQALLRQMQLQQLYNILQQQEGFAKLTPQQQQHLALQLLSKQVAQQQQQQQRQQQQQQQQQQPQPPAQPKLSPRSAEQPAPGHPNFQRSLSSISPPDGPVSAFHRTMSQPSGMDEAAAAPPVWAAANQPPPVSGAWTQPTSVWDIEPTKGAQTVEELQRIQLEQERERQLNMERQHREQEEMEAQRRREDELRKQQEEIERLHQEEMMKKAEMERQKDMERQRLERQRLEQLRREQEELRRREEEERERRRQEDERRRNDEIKRQQTEVERRRKEQEELERKRQEEIRRRQVRAEMEKAEEHHRQQEVLRRLQQEQLSKIQLPSQTQWANATPTSVANNAPSLSEIQQMEARQEEEKQRMFEQQRQQLAAIQQQHQQATKSWTQQNRVQAPPGAGSKSLLEIQQEQARQLELEKLRQLQNKAKVIPLPEVSFVHQHNVPLATAAVWGGSTSSSSNWASEGAWGNMQKQQAMGFWDDAVGASSKKSPANSNAHFPVLNSVANPQQQPANKSKPSKSNKDEETVQRLFQAMKPKDEFTQWCENALKGMQSSVDIPTFIAFLQDVESPYEVHDYVRSYLGEGKEATEFGRSFLEKRSKYKNELKQQKQPEEDMWGPAPAVTPAVSRGQSQSAAQAYEEFKSNKKKKGKKMSKAPNSLLGFTVHAAPDRLVGELDVMD